MSFARLAVATALGLTALPTSSAFACSAPICSQSKAFPANGFVPANMVKLRFTPGFTQGEPGARPTPRLWRMEGGNKVPLPFERTAADADSEWITPTETLPVGTELVLEAEESFCPAFEGAQPLHATYTVTEAKPIPTALGTLGAALEREITYVPASGSCTTQVDAAYADLFVNHSAEAQPYAFLFAHQLYVDGQPHAPFRRSQLETEFDALFANRIFTICYQEPQSKHGGEPVSAGTHTVRLESTLPDGTRLNTPDVEVTLRCDGPPLISGDPDGGRPAVDAGPKRDGGSASREDAAVQGGVDGGAAPSTGASEQDGCSLTVRGSSSTGLWLALALLLRRRRRDG